MITEDLNAIRKAIEALQRVEAKLQTNRRDDTTEITANELLANARTDEYQWAREIIEPTLVAEISYHIEANPNVFPAVISIPQEKLSLTDFMGEVAKEVQDIDAQSDATFIGLQIKTVVGRTLRVEKRPTHDAEK